MDKWSDILQKLPLCRVWKNLSTTPFLLGVLAKITRKFGKCFQNRTRQIL